jgi:hypothetical protein
MSSERPDTPSLDVPSLLDWLRTLREEVAGLLLGR